MTPPPRYIPVTKGEHVFVRQIGGQWRILLGLPTAPKVATQRKPADLTVALLNPRVFETQEMAQAEADRVNNLGDD